MKDKIPLKLGTLIERSYNRGAEKYKEVGIIVRHDKKTVDWQRSEIVYKIKLFTKNPSRLTHKFAYIDHFTLVQFWNIHE